MAKKKQAVQVETAEEIEEIEEEKGSDIETFGNNPWETIYESQSEREGWKITTSRYKLQSGYIYLMERTIMGGCTTMTSCFVPN